MTLRARLVWLTLAMVAVVVITLVALNMNTLVQAWLDSSLERSDVAGKQVQNFMLRRIEERVASAPQPPDSLEATKRFWNQIVSEDEDLKALLEQTMAQSKSVIEINIAGQDRHILASSNPARTGELLVVRRELRALRNAGAMARIRAMILSREDHETHVTLGIKGQADPMFTIQILASLVLLRDAVLPDLIRVGFVSLLAFCAAIFCAYWVARLALHPLDRISHLIDGIVSGKLPEEKPGKADDAKELAQIEFKLSILGERFRDARQDASELRSNLDKVLEQLDAETRKQFESQIALSRRLAAINSLTVRVAHEIKNPLNSIGLRLEMLRSLIDEEVPEAAAEIAVLAEEVTRLDRVVRTFLDFNRPVELALEDVDIAALVEDIARFLEPEAARKGIRSSYPQPETAIIVKGDNGLLRQALLNIAVNAIESMECGGRLGFGAATLNGCCDVTISDTGVGISSEQREKIFQLYFTTKPHGTGIGLAMAFRAVQLHGGSIDLQSAPGRGTTFHISLPLTAAESAG